MTDTFQTRIPLLSDEALRRYLENHLDYRTEAVEVALAELERRGLTLSQEERQQIQSGLALREAAAQAASSPHPGGLLGNSQETRRGRIRLITAGLLTAGLGSAVLIYLMAPPPAANPLGYEPMDTKRYLRDLELYGGKVNVLATELMRWWEGLWHGRNLAFTVAWLTLLLAFGFWFLTTRRLPPGDPNPDNPGPTSPHA